MIYLIKTFIVLQIKKIPLEKLPETLKLIKKANEERGVIIFTDPDYPGERIRKIVSNYINSCKHAFIKKEESTVEVVKKCPECGGDLIVRGRGKKKFLGCSNYPKCHHIEKLDK